MVRPKPKTYSLPAHLQHFLSQEAVKHTSSLNRPVSCRDVLQVILELAPRLDPDLLATRLKDRAL